MHHAFEECGSEDDPLAPFEYSVPKEPTLAEAKEQGYTQAAGHPPYGITDFKVNTEGKFPNEAAGGRSEGKVVTHVRTDVGPGVSTNPEAMAQCSMEEFDGNANEKKKKQSLELAFTQNRNARKRAPKTP